MVPETRHIQVPKQIMVPVQETVMVPQVRICVRRWASMFLHLRPLNSARSDTKATTQT